MFQEHWRERPTDRIWYCVQIASSKCLQTNLKSICEVSTVLPLSRSKLIITTVELLDPRWKEQKAKSDSRFATTNLSTQDVANNLKRLASQRSDLFDGATGQPITEEEAARRKKAATSYDGTPLEKGDRRLEMVQNVNVEEQIRAIHQKFGEKK